MRFTMTGCPSSTPVPVPSVLEIDESEYPFCSPLFEPETTNGLRILELLDTRIKWCSGSRLSYFEVAGGKGGMLIFKRGLVGG